MNDGHWFNIGSRREYLEVHRTILEQNWKPKYLTNYWPQQIAPDARIDPTAKLTGAFSIGAGAQVGAEAQIENTIVWPCAQIASRSSLTNCIVRSHRTAEGTLRDIDL